MSDIVERLLNDAESHYEVARSADMRPEDTLNWEHGQNCQDAADTITRLRADIISYKIGNKDLQDHCTEITSLTAEVEQNAIDLEEYRRDVEKLRAALLVARKYVLVQSSDLSLKPEDAARDLDVIDEALEEVDNG